MTRRTGRFLLYLLSIFILILPILSVSAAAAANENLLQNGGFEDVQAEIPVKWSSEGYRTEEAVTRYVIDQQEAHQGSYSIHIESTEANDARWIQRIAVTPSTMYKLSGWIKASGVIEEKTGANLSIMGSGSASRDIKDSQGNWEYVDLYGKTGKEQTEAIVAARLGFYGNDNLGKAWFDDIKFEAIETLPDGAALISFDSFANEDSGDANDESNGDASAGEAAIDSKELSGFYTRFMIVLTCVVYVGLALLIVRYANQSTIQSKLRSTGLSNSLGSSSETISFAVVMVSAGLFRLILAPFAQGFGVDVGTFSAWAMHAWANGLPSFYQDGMFADYPPGYIYVLYLIGMLFDLFGAEPGQAGGLFLLKLPPMIADLLIGWWIYRQIKPTLGHAIANAFALLYVFNPAVWINSTVWAQVDSAFTIFLGIFLVYLSRRQMPRASVFLAIAVLIKPQALIFGLIYLLVFIEWLFRDQRQAFQALWRSALLGLGTFFIGILPFVIQKGIVEKNDFFQGLLFIWEKYTTTLASYPYGSVNAFNIHALFGNNWTSIDTVVLGLTLNTWGWVGVSLSIAYAIYLFLRAGDQRSERVMLVGLWLLMAFVTLGPKMHERYLYPAMMISLLVMIFRADRRMLWLFLGITVAHYSNVAYILGNSFVDYIHIRDDVFMTLSSLLQVILLGATGWLAWDLLIRKSEGIALVPDHASIMKSGVNSKSTTALGYTTPGTSGNQSSDPLKPYQWFKPTEVQPWRRLDTILIVGLTVIYSAIAIYNLGSDKAPESFWRPANAGSSVVADLGDVRQVGNIAYFGGLLSGKGKFAIESSRDKNKWVYIASIETTEGGMYQWKQVPTSTEGRYFRVVVQTPNAMLNEVGFVSEDGKTIWPIQAVEQPATDPLDKGTPSGLFDEQDTIVLKSSFYDSMYFDEIYHARTAYEHLNQIEPYESTHPPLGKIFIAAGVKLFGMNPYGWRIAGTLFGIMMVPILYFFGRRLFGTTRYAFITSLLMTFDFMHFAQTRIATIDVYGVFFILLMYYYMWRHLTESDDQFRRSMIWLSLSGLFFGMGAASKWICLYAGVGLGFLWLLKQIERYLNFRSASNGLDRISKKSTGMMEQLEQLVRQYPKQLLITLGVSVITFVIIPLLIYTASYIPFMQVPPEQGHQLKDVVTYQKHMYNYHKNLVAEHPFASTWYQWPIMTRPIWYYGGSPEDGVISSIASFGNPAVWWASSIAMLICMGLWFRRKDPILLFIIIGFLSQFLPWVLVPRLTFIYHFFASVPFIILALVYLIRLLEERRKDVKWIVNAYLIVVVLLFALFYPVLSGYPIEREYAKAWLDWFSSPGMDWIFIS